MKEWRVNVVYKLIIFVVFLLMPVVVIRFGSNTDIYVEKYIYIYVSELVVLLCSYFMYEIRLKGFYNKLVKKTLQINDKFSIKNDGYKKFMGLDSFSSFEYFFNEELDKLSNELDNYRRNYKEMQSKREDEMKKKESKLGVTEKKLKYIKTEGQLASQFLNQSIKFINDFRDGVKKYEDIFEELSFHLKNSFIVDELFVVKKTKENYEVFKNISNEDEDIDLWELEKLEGLDKGLYTDKIIGDKTFDLVAVLKVEDKVHGFVLIKAQKPDELKSEIILDILGKIFTIFISIIDLYYQMYQKENIVTKLNCDISRLKKELKETDENLEIHLEQMSNMYEEIVTLYEVGKKIGKIYDKEDIEEAILNTLLEITETEFALTYYYEKDKLKVSKLINWSDKDFIENEELDEVLSKLFFDMKKAEKAIIVNELTKLDNYSKLSENIKKHIKNFVEAPIIIGQEIMGGVILFNKQDEFTAANVNLITSLINQMSISVQNIDNFVKEIDRQKEEEQLKIASHIQSGLFPQKMPRVLNANFYGLNIPAKAVGGDYYDLVQVDENRVIGFIADVSGKGIPASLLVSIVRTIFRMIVEEFREYRPEEILTRINSVLLKENLEGRFVTAACFMLNSTEKRLEVSSAGHDPFLYYNQKEKILRKYPSESIVLGIMEEVYERIEIDFDIDDLFLFYTDGVAEARKDDGEFFTLERVEKFVKENFEKNSEDFIKSLYGNLKDFVKDAKQNDDITLLAIKGGNISEGA